MKKETGVLTPESMGQIMRLIDKKPYLDPQVGVHLRSNEELSDLTEICSRFSPQSLYVGMVGSRLGGKIFRSFNALRGYYNFWWNECSREVFQAFIDSLPSRVGGLHGDQTVNVSDIAPLGSPPMTASELIYDFDVVTVPKKPVTDVNRQVIAGVSSGTPFDIWHIPPRIILTKSNFHEIFDNSLRLRL